MPKYVKTGEYRDEAWDVDIDVSGKIDWAKNDMQKNILKAKIKIAENCDIDCQRRGSQLTVIASLMSGAYGVIGLNALFMFIGAWRYRWRVCSLYCTFVACLCQAALMIVAATMMFTEYNGLCAYSLTPTMEGFRWTMSDDFSMTFGLWFAGWILMIPFVCCGMCNSYVSYF